MNKETGDRQAKKVNNKLPEALKNDKCEQSETELMVKKTDNPSKKQHDGDSVVVERIIIDGTVLMQLCESILNIKFPKLSPDSNKIILTP